MRTGSEQVGVWEGDGGFRVGGLGLSTHFRSEAKCREAPRQGRGLSGDSGRRFRVCCCARKLVREGKGRWG